MNELENTVIYILGDLRPHTHTIFTPSEQVRYTREMDIRGSYQYLYTIAEDISQRPSLPFKKLQTAEENATYVNHRKMTEELKTLNTYLATLKPTQIKMHYIYLHRIGTPTAATDTQPRIHSPETIERRFTPTNTDDYHS